MRPLFEAFRWKRPTYALDWPGFGLSDRPALAYGNGLFARVLAEFLAFSRGAHGPADVVALGYGCVPAARVAVEEPGLVRSLVMLHPNGLLPARAGWFELLAARLSASLGDAAARLMFAVLSTRAMVWRSLSARFYGIPDEALFRYAHRSAHASGAHRAPLAVLAAAARGGEAELAVRGVAVPSLVVHDARGAAEVEVEAFLRGRLNRYATRVAATRGLPQFERRAETIAALDRFWLSFPRAACDQAMR